VSETKARTDLSRRLTLAVGIPVGLLLAVGGIMWAQLARMRELGQWVDHTDQVIARIYEAQRDIAVQEAAFRGLLLSGDRSLLDRYAHAHTAANLGEVRRLVADNPAQQVRIDEIALRHDNWLRNTAPAQDEGTDLAPFRTKNAFEMRRRLLDGAQSALVKMVEAEQELRRQRVLQSSTANDDGVRVALLLFVALALAIAFFTRRQLTAVAETYATSLANERATRRLSEDQNWIRSALMQLSARVAGELTLEQLGQHALEQLAVSANAVVAAFYVGEPTGFRRHASHGLAADAPDFFAHGDGLVSRAAAQTLPLHVREAPGSFLKVRTGVAESVVSEVVLIPATLDGVTTAVLEFGFFGQIDARVRELFERIGETIATAVRSTHYRQRLRELLEESRRQTEELQTQQEELRVANEELQSQSDALRSAHAQLEERKEELESSNAHLVSQRDALERMQRQLADKASEVERASRYKSEFLANMSHELRTPLNSTLILAKVLADNKTENLTAEQIKFANTIYAAGTDLLLLINDILDLSKIEAGKVDVHAVSISVSRLVEPLVQTFEPQAKQQNLAFAVSLETDACMLTDEQRVRQILKNLLSNAFKFTAQGTIGLSVRGEADWIEFAVRDTGIGIPENQHDVIFEAFRQADGTTNRRFGGTGLGLSISRDLAQLLGGELRVESEPGQGSCFTLRLPREHVASEAAESPSLAAGSPAAHALAPRPVRSHRRPVVPELPPSAAVPRAPVAPGQRSLLVVEDDVAFTEVLAHLARELDFQFFVAHTADEGIRLALEVIPSAVILDMRLPDHSGLSVLDRLKRDPRTRHIPVHVCSVADFSQAALSMGAVGYLFKPVKYEELSTALESIKQRFQSMRRLLVVEDDAVQRDAITELLKSQTIELVAVATVGEALAELRQRTFDCVVTDLTLPDASGYDLLQELASNENCPFPPVIVYTGRSLTSDEEQRLRQYSSSIIIKGARSPERLLDEVTLFLHQIEAELPADRQRMLRQARDREAAFAGRKILLAEDDVRNVFALGHVLEPKGAELVIARNGREALEMLDRNPDIDLVLMDIMMPEMDGLSAIRAIREAGGNRARLPIIALTAKAMPDDQERCLKAGANDYMAKPLDVEMLLSLIRVWMPKVQA
jgi:signal transduction histidine kinase/DNA-binding response OmpR family regulator/CHASE3 domain sensor protein